MAEEISHDPELEIVSFIAEPLDDVRAIVTLTGRWRGESPQFEARPVLTVEVPEGRHRFAAISPRPPERPDQAGHFSARFAVPAKLLPELREGASLAVGDEVVQMPGLDNEAADAPAATTAATGAGAGRGAGEGDGTAENGSSDAVPIATAAEELRRRAASEARLRGELAELRARMSARTDADARLDEMRETLRGELEQVRELIGREDQRRSEIESRAMVLAAELAEAQQHLAEMRDRLRASQEEVGRARAEAEAAGGEARAARAAAEGARSEVEAARAVAEAATVEVAGLEAELERLEVKLAGSPGEFTSRDGGLQEAESLLAEARELNALLRQR